MNSSEISSGNDEIYSENDLPWGAYLLIPVGIGFTVGGTIELVRNGRNMRTGRK